MGQEIDVFRGTDATTQAAPVLPPPLAYAKKSGEACI
jgi:hypothetical protein